MIKAIIIDDERGSIDSLLWELENWKDKVDVIATIQSPKAAKQIIETHNPDLIFLDIQMPEMNGFEFLKYVGEINFNIIFTTAYDQYAIKAFRVNAIDYLLKPVGEEELARALEKVMDTNQDETLMTRLTMLMDNISMKDESYKVVVLPTSEGLEFIEIESIHRCESDSNYTYIHRKGEKALLVAKTLKEIEEMLEGKGFYRIHHSHLVNLRYIKKYNKGKAGSLTMKDGTIIPISRSRKKNFLEEL